MSEVSIPHVKMTILLLYHPKIQEFFKRTFLKTIIIKNICFSRIFNVSQSPLSDAKDYFSLAPSVSELIGFFSLIFFFEMDSNKHDTTLIILKLITETSEKETLFCSEMICDVNI